MCNGEIVMNKIKVNTMREDNGRHPLITVVWVLLTITVFVTMLGTILTTLL